MQTRIDPPPLPSEWLAEQSNQGCQIWAIVDASAPESAAAVQWLDKQADCVNVLAHVARELAALAIAPRMVPVKPEAIHKAIRDLWQTQQADEPVLFFIATHQTPDHWIAGMRRRVRVKMPDNEFMIFRWWDARIWWALHEPSLQTQPDVVDFLSACQASAWVGRDGTLQTANQPARPTDALEGQASWVVSHDTLGELLTLGEPDAVLGLCRNDYPDALSAVPPGQRHALAQSQIEWAKKCGFTSPEDHALAVRIAADGGPDWANDPQWATLISQALRDGQTLRAAVAAA